MTDYSFLAQAPCPRLHAITTIVRCGDENNFALDKPWKVCQMVSFKNKESSDERQ